MSTNKQAHIRYLTLDKCFRNPGRKFFIDDLVDACNNAINEFYGIDEGVQKRQVYDDIKFMESPQGWNIALNKIKDGRKVYYRYINLNFSISREPLNEVETNQIKETIETLLRFKGMPQFEWIEEISARLRSTIDICEKTHPIIEFEQNLYLKGSEFITPLYNAINYERVIEVAYQPFNVSRATTHLIHPYFLKQYNNRWFLFGWNGKDNFLMNLALDRIVGVSETGLEYIDKGINFSTYFEDVVGVTVPSDKKVEKVELLVSTDFWPYIETKPIHGSQKSKGYQGDYMKVELAVIINYELTALLFSYGDKIIIESPLHLRENLLKTAKSLISKY